MASLPPPDCGHRSGREGDELERDAARVAEGEDRAVGRVDDPTVGDAEFVEPGGPRLEPGTIGAAEGAMVEPRPAFVEGDVGQRFDVLMEPDERLEPNDVPVGRLLTGERRIGAEEPRAPGGAALEIAGPSGRRG